MYLQLSVMEFYLDPMPLDSSIEENSKRLLRALDTPPADAIFD